MLNQRHQSSVKEKSFKFILWAECIKRKEKKDSELLRTDVKQSKLIKIALKKMVLLNMNLQKCEYFQRFPLGVSERPS